MSWRRATALCWMALAVTVPGCARPNRPSSAPTPEPAPDTVSASTTSAELQVVNESIFDVRVFVIRAGQFTRLGLVGSTNTASFQLGPHIIDREISLYADPVGATRRQRTDAIYVRPGQQIRFGLERLMRSYSLAVY